MIDFPLDEANSTAFSPVSGIAPEAFSFTSIHYQGLQVNLGLDGSTVGDSRPAPYVCLLRVGTGSQQSAEHREVSLAAGKVEGGVPVYIGLLDRGVGALWHVGEEDLENSVVAPQTRLHDSVAATHIAAQDAGGVPLTE